MGFLDSLHKSNIVNDPASQFDRTNIGSGILQARAAIAEALTRDNPLLDNAEFPAIALWVSPPTVITPISEYSSASTLPLAPLSTTYVTIPKMMIKIYFRVPLLHSGLPLPEKFSSTATDSLSALKPDAREQLLISCHPCLYADYENFSEVNAGDQIEIKFDDKSYSSAKIIKIEKKSVNNIGSEIVSFVSSIIDIFDDAAETAILGSDIKISPEAKRIGEILYNNMKERDACTFLKFWKEKWFKKIEGVPAAARKYPASAAAIKEASKAYNLNEEMMRGIARIESGFNPLAGPNPRSGALGLYQILPGFKKRYGVTDITILDPNLHALAVAKVLSQNIEDATFRLGRPPEPWEVYVMHNQGPDGFYAQSVACQLYGPGGGKEEIQRATQLIINNNFIGSYQGSSPQSGRFFIGGRSKKVSITNPEHHVGLKPDIPSLKNLTRI